MASAARAQRLLGLSPCSTGPAVREVLHSPQQKGRRNLFVSKSRAAEILGLHPKTIERLITRGELAAYKPAGRVRIRREDLFAFLESVRVEPSVHEI